MTRTIKITRDIKVTDQDIDDIVCGALEGGINYWCSKATVVGEYLGDYASDQISRGGILKLYDSVDGKEYDLDSEKLIKGIQLAFSEGYANSDWLCEGHMDELECGMIDANACDIIIQLALFEEVVYG